MKAWEKTFLKYCVQERLLTSEQAEQISSQKTEMNVLALVSKMLGWDANQEREHLAKACPDREEEKPSESQRDLSVGFS